MNEKLKVLVALQAVDDRLTDLEWKLARIPVEIERLRAVYQKEQKAQDELNSLLEGSLKERRSAERELEVHEEKIKKLKEQQFMVKTNKEYQTMQHEVSTMEEKKGSLEEKVLTMMDQAAEAERSIKAQAEAVARERETFGREEARLVAERTALEAEVAAVRQERAGIVSLLGDELLRAYGKLREFHKGRAVVAVIDGICQGCHLALRPQKFQEVKRNEEVLACDQCKRIIWHQEAKGDVAAPPVAEG